MAKIKPGTPHPNRGGMVMGMNSRYVSKGTYAKQKKASKPAPSKKVTPKTTSKSTTPKSLPSAGNTSATKDTPRNFPRGRASAKRALKAAELERAKQGTKGGTRTGQPAGRANRVHGANVTARATRRAVRETALRNAGRTGLKILGKAGQLISGDGSGQALMHAVTVSNLIDAARGSTAEERNAKKKGQSGLSKNQQETLRKQADANRRRRNEKSRVRKVGNPTDKTRATYNKPTSKPTTKSSPKPKAKPDNRSTLTKEIDGLTKFIATHKGKKGMERGLSQARKSLALKKKKKSQRSTTMSGNTSGSSRSIG